MKSLSAKDVLLDDADCIVLNKPSGLAVQADRSGGHNLLSMAERYSGQAVFLVHRLDRPSSGIVLFAKHKQAAISFSKLWHDRRIHKEYIAATPISKHYQKGKWEDFLWHHKKKNKSYVVEHADDGAKLAVLRYQKVCEVENYQLFQIQLYTGRHHQIRAQLSARNLPIKGDNKYGSKRANKDRSIHLHAWRLRFVHPFTQQDIFLQAPPSFDALWDAFDRKKPSLGLRQMVCQVHA